MKREEAQRVLREEGLKRYNWYGDHPVRPGEMIIAKEGDRWVVSASDERAAVVDTSIVDFDTEEEALDYFIPLVQLEKSTPRALSDIPEVSKFRNTVYWLTHPPGYRDRSRSFGKWHITGLWILLFSAPSILSAIHASIRHVNIGHLLLGFVAVFTLIAIVVLVIGRIIKRKLSESQKLHLEVGAAFFIIIVLVGFLLFYYFRLSLSKEKAFGGAPLLFVAAFLLCFGLISFILEKACGESKYSPQANPNIYFSFFIAFLVIFFKFFPTSLTGSGSRNMRWIAEGIASWFAPFFG